MHLTARFVDVIILAICLFGAELGHDRLVRTPLLDSVSTQYRPQPARTVSYQICAMDSLGHLADNLPRNSSSTASLASAEAELQASFRHSALAITQLLKASHKTSKKGVLSLLNSFVQVWS